MRLSRVRIRNYRNFKQLDVALDGHAVIVGENRVGKTNFLCALRLVLDPGLADTARELRDEDFWDGLPRPLTAQDSVEVSVELRGFEDDPGLFAILGDSAVQVDADGHATGRLTYVYRPRATLGGAAPASRADYEWLIYKGGREEEVFSADDRRRMPLDVLQALRDAEGALANWRQSPLRPLIEEAARVIPRDRMVSFAEALDSATEAVVAQDELQTVAARISRRVERMVGAAQAMDTELGFAPTDPGRLLRTLRLFIDGRRRGIAEASLGSANLLYLALASLEREQAVRLGERSHTFFGIEEPEAHLHPHLQRLVYRDFLRPRTHLTTGDDPAPAAEPEPPMTKLLTTHSPHIVSVSPVRSLVLLRQVSDPGGAPRHTEARSTAALELTEDEVADLERYLDISRGEIVFARGVVLVEGEAELYLVPAIAKRLGIDLDRLGISVCSVAGTNFVPYVRLLGRDGLDLPFSVLTDWDPRAAGARPGPPYGATRIASLLTACGAPAVPDVTDEDELRRIGREHGIFTNAHTLEVDLFHSGEHATMAVVLAELTESGGCRERADGWRADPSTLNVPQFLSDVDRIGKGRYAQCLAPRLNGGGCPEYIAAALRHVAEQCA